MTRLVTILSLIVLPAASALAQGEPFVYPSKGQSQRQQDVDTAECRRWAQSQNAGRPAPQTGSRAGGTVGGAARGAALGAAVGAIAGDAGKGAAAGAVVGGVGGRRRAIGREREARASVENDYARAFAACMEARGYSVR